MGCFKWYSQTLLTTSRSRCLTCENEERRALEEVFGLQFKNLLAQFRDELKEFDARSPVADSVREIRDVCDIMSGLGAWRNDRIHARVRMTNGGYALYDWRTGQRLELHTDQITKNIELAVKAIVTLEAHMPHLVGQLEFDEELYRSVLSTLPELSETPDDIEADPAMAWGSQKHISAFPL